ncbi:MAG: 30S ribosomal protein S12 methylthiotransferase RimO [Magnetococcales bacterium]|nr:30S ribosomal protein S12 methylthiotransferase RimO [Magnetococcales bacterium]
MKSSRSKAGGKKASAASASPRVGLISLGCAKNQVDSEHLLGQFLSRGYRLTANPEKAQVLVVNTCGFLAAAEEESREAIREMSAIRQAHPDKRLVVTGCLAQRMGDALLADIPGIDLMVGSAQSQEVVTLLDQVNRGVVPKYQVKIPLQLENSGMPRVRITPAYTAYLKIAEGCDNPCSFCIIPQLRGHFRSRPPEDLLTEARHLVAEGVKELNLVSQDTTLYGRDLQPRSSLSVLIRELDALPGLRWIRLLYLYPTLINEELLRTMAASAHVLPYFDMPLQHVDGGVLAAMRRAERPEGIRKLLTRIREILPEATLRTTFLVGFPGESEAAFANLEALVAEGWFDHVGVFCYSDEAEAASHAFENKVPQEIAEARRERIMAVQQEISRQRLARRVGQRLTVLVEGPSEENQGILTGRSAAQAPEVDGQVFLVEGWAEAGSLVEVEVTQAHEYDLVGRIRKVL